MRTATEIKETILRFAENDKRVRAVLLNGSRANPNIKPDKFSDFDIVFIVNNIKSFFADPQWIDFFGKKIIMQLPDAMTFGKNISNNRLHTFSYLMLFKDRNRIDLTLVSKQQVSKNYKPESLTLVWLDKDGLFNNLGPSENDYHVKKPSQKEFADVSNEFWWVSTYVAKGLARNEISYAKEMMEMVVRPMFMKISEWKFGIETKFAIPFGKAGKNMKDHFSKKTYKKILATYSNDNIDENWKALFLMTKIFNEFSLEISSVLKLRIDTSEPKNVMKYLKQVHKENK